jgi:hypothetical protein
VLTTTIDEPLRRWRKLLLATCAAILAGEGLFFFLMARNMHGINLALDWPDLLRLFTCFILVVGAAAACLELLQHRRSERLGRSLRLALVVVLAVPFAHLSHSLIWLGLLLYYGR